MKGALGLRIDVSRSSGLPGKVEMAASVWLPDRAALPANPVVMFCVPGAGYARGYFDLHFDGREDYSQIAHHLARGVIVIALDHVGVGDSTLPDPAAVTFDVLAATYDAAASEICGRLRDAGLDPAFGPLARFTTIGTGQSMGGCVTILAQGRHATFDAIAILGFSAIQTVVPQPRGAQVRQGSAASPAIDLRYPFHWEDVPADMVSADMGGVFPVRERPVPWGSPTIPGCVQRMTSPGAVAAEAAAVRVPVFLGNGERDVCPEPRAEPTAYGRSNDITVCVYPGMAHMHNFATNRRQLWDDLVDWSCRVARAAGG